MPWAAAPVSAHDDRFEATSSTWRSTATCRPGCPARATGSGRTPGSRRGSARISSSTATAWCRCSASTTGNAFNEGNKIFIDAPVALGNRFPVLPGRDRRAPFDLMKSAPHVTHWTVDLQSRPCACHSGCVGDRTVAGARLAAPARFDRQLTDLPVPASIRSRRRPAGVRLRRPASVNHPAESGDSGPRDDSLETEIQSSV
jgi:hypothetical protein